MKDHYVVLVTTAPSLHPSTRQLATRLAHRSHAVLLFLHVLPFRRSDGEAMLHAAAELRGGHDEAWVRTLTPSDAGVRFRHRVEAGEPEEIVARFVEAHNVDLVVAEEPPRNWVSEALWRGLAERLIRQVDCPVVIGGPGFLRTAPPAPLPARSPLADTTVAEMLRAMVEARVEAVTCWMDHAADAARRVANAPTVDLAATLASRAGGRIDRRLERRLQVEMEEHRRALQAASWQLVVGPHGWSSDPALPLNDPALARFLARVHQRGHSTSLPLAVGKAHGGLVVLAGATVADGQGTLVFAFDAESDFLRILGQPGPHPSFETYAFDDRGMMLSNSRFPDHLLAAGLLPSGHQTPLRLRVAEPSDGPVEAWPLTRMAQQATHHHDGFDTRGYLDYRGTPVVGAWRWVAAYGFGVTAELDRDAAYR